MKFYNALSDFLYDKNYFITIFENNIHIYKYIELTRLTSEEIILQLPDFQIVIIGNNLIIKQMNSEELIVQGDIVEVKKIYA